MQSGKKLKINCSFIYNNLIKFDEAASKYYS